MNTPEPIPNARTTDPRLHPFRRAILRGLAVLLPPLLTIIIFIWVWNTVTQYMLAPLEDGVTWALMSTYYNDKIKNDAPENPGKPYHLLANGQWIPLDVYEEVRRNPGADAVPSTPQGVYRRYIEIKYLKWYYVGPVFIGGMVIILGLLGRFMAVGLGRMSVNLFERLLHRLPIVRNVYGSVKQVTDFVFSEREIEFTRVVAVEYPRKGIWSLGFVTGESMLDIRGAANEPVVSVLMPTSPMPMTGFTVNVKKSETVDLNITIDQALQFVVSCGVVVPPHQLVAVTGPKPEEKLIGTASENGARRTKPASRYRKRLAPNLTELREEPATHA